MALTREALARTYPRPACAFRVTVEGESGFVRFARVSGLEQEYKTLTYSDGLSFLDGEGIVKYYVDKYITVTLEQGVVAGDDFLVRWLEERGPRNLSVSLCGEAGVPLVSWHIARALAVKLTGPSFDAATNEVAIDRLEVKAAGIRIEHH